MSVRANFIFNLWRKLKNKNYREGYVDAQFSVEIPFQINRLRTTRGWTQAELARRSGLSSGYISKIEQAGNGPRTISTLQKLCNAFDIALFVRFVPFSNLVKENQEFNIGTFDATPFSEDSLSVEYEDYSHSLPVLSDTPHRNVGLGFDSFYSENEPTFTKSISVYILMKKTTIVAWKTQFVVPLFSIQPTSTTKKRK